MNRFSAILTIIVLINFTIISEGSAAHNPSPSPPRKITIQQQNNGILLKWKKPLTKIYAGFRIYRSQTKNKLGVLVAELNKKTFSFKDLSLELDTIYFYTVHTFKKTAKNRETKNNIKPLFMV